MIEAAKPQTLAVDDYSDAAIFVFAKDKELNYQLSNTSSSLKEVAIYSLTGQQVLSENANNEKGHVDLERFATGFYFAKFTLENGHNLTKKFILK